MMSGVFCMTISLCMIVKNEEDNLGRCLESVKQLVDEMIIVDTGSTDSTVTIAERYGARVYHFEWNDNFSEARNYGLKQASGDWVMIMDADDEMEKLEKQDIVKMIETTDADAFFFETISYVGEKPGSDVIKNMNLRLMKNHQGYYFSNPIHEQIYCNIMAANPNAKIVNCDMKVYHYGYLNKNIAGNNKRARNIALLEKELEQRPDYNFAIFNLGSEYYAMGDNRKAIGYFEKAYEKFDPQEGYSSHLILKMAVCYIGLGRFEEALRIADAGLSHYPQFTDLVYMKGNAYSAMGRNALALKCYKRCCEMGEPPNYLNVIIGSGTYRPHFMTGNIYFDWEDYESAAESYKQAFLMNTEFMEALSLLISAWCRLKPEPSALEENIEALRTLLPASYDSIVFERLMNEKFYALALRYIGRYEETNGTCAYSQYFTGLCRLYQNDYRGAIEMMQKARDNEEYRMRSVCLEALARILDGDHAAADELLASGCTGEENAACRVYLYFNNLLRNRAEDPLSDDEQESLLYTPYIFDILKILLVTRQPEIFEKALQMLNAVNDKTVLLRLAKLYYSENCFALAYNEFLRSIKLFDCIDAEGAKMLSTLKSRGF